VQLDNTRITIRQRGLLETLDLSLHLMWYYARPLSVAFLIMAVPLFLINDLCIGWMANVEFEENLIWARCRFLWTMSLLVFIQAPLASLLTTMYLGRVIFRQETSIRDVIWETIRLAPRWIPCQMFHRGVVPAWILLLFIPRGSEFSAAELLFPFLAFCMALVRSCRPFLNEIIVLERNPVHSSGGDVITIARRNSSLHAARYSDLVGRWLGSAVIAIALAVSLVGTVWFVSGVVHNNWGWGPVMVRVGVVAAMWIVPAYFSVVRYLSYLDLRIRNEGWDVELLLRAEAARLMRQLA